MSNNITYSNSPLRLLMLTTVNCFQKSRGLFVFTRMKVLGYRFCSLCSICGLTVLNGYVCVAAVLWLEL